MNECKAQDSLTQKTQTELADTTFHEGLKRLSSIRDNFGFGITLGSSTTLHASYLLKLPYAIEVEFDVLYGAIVSTWGWTESIQAGIGNGLYLKKYDRNSLFWLFPGFHYIHLTGSNQRHTWFDWTPYTTVHAVEGYTEIGWIHEYDLGISFELRLHTGIGIGINGRDSDNEPVSGKESGQIYVLCGLRF